MPNQSASGPSRSQNMVRPTEPEDWEPYRTVISDLYERLKLRDVMKEMERVYSFKATEKQYKTQIKKWNLDTKYTKGSEYLAMIKTKRRREREDPPKDTRFILRESVEDLVYETPSPTLSSHEDEGGPSEVVEQPMESLSPMSEFLAGASYSQPFMEE
ncbi:hypothetical protein VTK73DRAFT_8386 [Phialemonium thermophilum]|uniref:Clr5 domain-containing protein n=1 Tax=Phialemonium thermophilum TaxID=223376 RepID=A0ABR3XQ54_9PEZI